MNLMELSEQYSTTASGLQSRLISLREEAKKLRGEDAHEMGLRISALQSELRDMSIVINELRSYYVS